ncbi:MAG: hypothetical protein JWO33_2928 [Caulobacteraceae bacterium]|nr:hypothetical protein [Caulobacteraceae bacterium]
MVEEPEARSKGAAKPVHAAQPASPYAKKRPRWRKLFSDYVIVFLGVVTALAAEQAVEKLHERYVIRDALEVLAETQPRMLDQTGVREGLTPCLAEQFEALQAALDQASATGRLPPIASVREPVRDAWTMTAYDSVVAGGALAFMPVKQRRYVTAQNLWSGYLQRNRDVEVHAWNLLRTMEGAGRPIADSELAALRAALSEAVYQAQLMRGAAAGMSTSIGDSKALPRQVVQAEWRKGFERGRTSFTCTGVGKSGGSRILDVLKTTRSPFTGSAPGAPGQPQGTPPSAPSPASGP